MNNNGLTTSLHESVISLPKEVVHALLAIHTLSGCNTTSQVDFKLQAFNAGYKSEHAVLVDFDVKTLDDDMFKSAE